MKILIIGTGYMARLYYKHFNYLGVESKLLYRNLYSKNTSCAVEQIGLNALISEKEELNYNSDIVLVCTDENSHLQVLSKYSERKSQIYTEKPVSLDIDEIKTFKRRDLRLLMNRRYYYWVEDIRQTSRNKKIDKVVVNLPEKNSNKKWNNMPIAIPVNSIHVIDLLFYICGELAMPLYRKKQERSMTIITNSKDVSEIIINMNYGAYENFSITFYLDSGNIIKVKPIEFAKILNAFSVIEPSENKHIRQYIPIGEEMKAPSMKFALQKYGILELCEDIIVNHNNPNMQKMPSIDESLKQMEWLRDAWN